MLLLKGFEIEIYTGTPAGQIIGFADRITADLPGFVREPDSRNVEYTTPPCGRYEQLLCYLIKPRVQLRQYLQSLGNYTLIPGSTLSLGDSQRFYRSDPTHPYHTYIEQTYGTKVVTASVHINIGINDPELLMRACRLVRVEAPLYLALSAASPFLDGQVTGYHSTRWGIFPKTPAIVPLFTSHQHFIDWTEAQLAAGTMQNVRHLWSAVRPNGDRRPYSLNRLELRVCDLVTDPIALLAITALLEARLWQLCRDETLDPLQQSQLDADALVALSDANEIAAARQSLDATLHHWQDGREIAARQWIEELYAEVESYSQQRGFKCFLSPVKKLLREGNTAQQWLRSCEMGLTVSEVIQQAIQALAEQEQELAGNVCQPMVA